MQKVEGSSPFIRSEFKPFPAFWCRSHATQVPQTWVWLSASSSLRKAREKPS